MGYNTADVNQLEQTCSSQGHNDWGHAEKYTSIYSVLRKLSLPAKPPAFPNLFLISVNSDSVFPVV